MYARIIIDCVHAYAITEEFFVALSKILLEKEIEILEQEKSLIEKELSSGDLLATDLLLKSKRFGVLTDLIDEKTLRWLELSEFA